jgi:hypothetical protein
LTPDNIKGFRRKSVEVWIFTKILRLFLVL